MKKTTARQRAKLVKEAAQLLMEQHIGIDGWAVTLEALTFIAEEHTKLWGKGSSLKRDYNVMTHHLREAKEMADEFCKYNEED